MAGSVTMKVWRLIRQSTSEVDLTSPYLVPGERGMQILDELSRRNVKLTMLTNSLAANDDRWFTRGTHAMESACSPAV